MDSVLAERVSDSIVDDIYVHVLRAQSLAIQAHGRRIIGSKVLDDLKEVKARLRQYMEADR